MGVKKCSRKRARGNEFLEIAWALCLKNISTISHKRVFGVGFIEVKRAYGNEVLEFSFS